MDTRVFEYIVTLAHTRNYTRAAKQLYMTPQGLSSAIKRLENSLGVPLFDMEDDGISLTEYGEVLHRYARSFVMDQNSMMNEINDLKRKNAGNILLFATIGLLNSFPGSAIDDFNANSRTGAHVVLSRTVFDKECESDLLDKTCDFALMNEPVDHSVFSSLPLFRDTMFLCVPADSPLSEKKEATRADLAGLTISCLAPKEFKNVRELVDSLEHSSPKCSFLYSDEMIAVFEQAIRNKCCAITLRPHAQLFLHEGFSVIPLNDVVWGFSLAWRSNRALSAQDREFLAFIKEHQEFHC